ncbi:MAG: FAD-dependent 5-carboxymethylaminomethyl-2-thiouridine(34) oxidoreductase MnmC [Rhodocyclaceae bacterium]|nr:FAD-dependent 5-carboxymethylaminomethyl-2-thiouridine(34) oxidoreductase MnmC [Rhodocyclaceae bacterium]
MSHPPLDLPGRQGLPERWAGRASFAILETGCAAGANFLTTWQAWNDDPQRPQRLHYFCIDAAPPCRDELARQHQPPTDLSAQLCTAWPSSVSGFHRLHFAGGRVSLTLVIGDTRTVMPRIEGRFDAFILDGLSLAEQSSAALRDDLLWLAADTQAAQVPKPQPHRVAVIGAGIAGVSCAERLAQRGWEVTLFERRDGPAAETSGNRQAVMLPVLSVDETRLARLNRVAYLYVLRQLAALAAAGHPVTWDNCGVFQIARHADHAKKQQAIVANQQLPAEFVQYLDADAASRLAGTTVSDGGWWFPQAGWLSPLSLCQALLAAAGANLNFRPATEVTALAPSAQGWQLLGSDGQALWDGSTVILANAHGLRTLEQSAHLPLRCFRGQVSHLPATGHPETSAAPLGGSEPILRAWGGNPPESAALPRCVVCREGYIAPPHDGYAGLGATFQRSHDTDLHVADHQSNLARLAGMLPELSDRYDATQLTGRVGLRPVSPDKLPMVGALPLASCEPRPAAHVEWPRWPGLFVASGYGARGFVWAPLMAELLASQICGEPLPIEAELAAAVDPARFTWKGTL